MSFEEWLNNKQLKLMKDERDLLKGDGVDSDWMFETMNQLILISSHLWEANEYANKEGERKRRMEASITYGYHLIHSKASKARDKVLKEIEA